ncbi:hypothetical protein HPB50_028417 [Hyalomma asiaticum]|nr:hypothetical protein HPB50_028417 [Hyalomma asiaticum]
MSQEKASQLKEYADALERLEQWQASYSELTQDNEQSKYCFDLLKAVTMPVNALSTSCSVMEKLEQLSNVLSGKPFSCGPRTVSTDTHPLALRFCLDKLAEKIVLQGEEQVVSNVEMAYPVAALAVGLWCRFPDLGDLLEAHFYKRCPALLPVFFSRSVVSSDIEYLRLCGYKCSGGVLEMDSLFLKRITGLMRLYAAMLQTPQPPWYKPSARSRHPPGSERGWQWIAVCLNTPTENPHMAATLIRAFLEVAGWALTRDYGNQFRKILDVLFQYYFPRLKQLIKTSSGPVSRLEDLLDQVLRDGQLVRPRGSLGAQVWK